MSLFKKLFKQTAIYGLATVVPRMMSFLLVPLYTDVLSNETNKYGDITLIFAWITFFNVVLSYGLETAFFRFNSSEENKKSVFTTSAISILSTSIFFLVISLFLKNEIGNTIIKVDTDFIVYAIWILVLDSLVVVPFSKLRATQRPLLYSVIKIGNTTINLLLNIFFLLLLPYLVTNNSDGFLSKIYIPGYEVGYIFISNLIASLVTFLFFVPEYFKMKWNFNFSLWKKMMRYAFPILIAGIAFAINEHFDKILLEWLLPKDIAKHEIGVYGACYKLGVFMVLFATAFRLGIEPFFFSYAKETNAAEVYALITKYFVVLGSFILLFVIVFSDLLKVVMIRNESYWEAMTIVPLILLANFMLGIYHNLSVWYKLTDRTKMGAYISIIGAIITLLLNFILIPKYSYLGSALATLLAYGSMMLISYKLGQKYYPIPYEINKISLYLGVSISLSSLYFYFFRENYFIGLISILIFSFILYKNEKDAILRIIKKK